MRLVYAQTSCQLADEQGIPWNVSENQVFTADHPLVKRHAWAFGDHPTRVNGERFSPVEAATAAPGERRRVG